MKFAALPLLLLIQLAGDAGLQAPQPYHVSVNVDLVVLHTSVLDQKGRTASDLREQDFEVYEDGIRQPIRLFRHEDVPVTVGLVVDHSGSMRSKLPGVIAAARAFVQSSNAEDQMFVVNFNEKVTLGLPEGVRFANRADELARAISGTPADGMTALYDAVFEALQQLRASNQDKKVLLVISDGGDNASKHTLSDVLRVVGQSSAQIYAIGTFDASDPDRNPGALRRLAEASGGVAFFPGELSEVVAICARIARDVRDQYTIGYAPAAAAKTGGYRSVRVAVRAQGKAKFVVRARTGYIAVDESAK